MEVASTPSLADRLKLETAALHREAESHPWQRALLTGKVDRGVFAAHQAQMYLVQKELEALLARERARGGAIGPVVRDYHFRAGLLESDLGILGVSSRADLSPATAGFLGWLQGAVETEPTAVLGVFYVLEGSTNGAKYIAKALERTLGLGVGAGLSYLDPHGEQLRPRWAQFRTDVDALSLSDEQRAAVVEAACRTFAYVSALMDELASPATA